jgi:hypothetical protein
MSTVALNPTLPPPNTSSTESSSTESSSTASVSSRRYSQYEISESPSVPWEQTAKKGAWIAAGIFLAVVTVGAGLAFFAFTLPVSVPLAAAVITVIVLGLLSVGSFAKAYQTSLCEKAHMKTMEKSEYLKDKMVKYYKGFYRTIISGRSTSKKRIEKMWTRLKTTIIEPLIIPANLPASAIKEMYKLKQNTAHCISAYLDENFKDQILKEAHKAAIEKPIRKFAPEIYIYNDNIRMNCQKFIKQLLAQLPGEDYHNNPQITEAWHIFKQVVVTEMLGKDLEEQFSPEEQLKQIERYSQEAEWLRDYLDNVYWPTAFPDHQQAPNTSLLEYLETFTPSKM